MTRSLPLLVFPQAKTMAPPKGKGFPSSQPHVPGHTKQAVRLGAQLAELTQEFDRYKANISGSAAGLEPETDDPDKPAATAVPATACVPLVCWATH
jgi:hypothetical protein